VGQSTEWVGPGLPGLNLKPPLQSCQTNIFSQLIFCKTVEESYVLRMRVFILVVFSRIGLLYFVPSLANNVDILQTLLISVHLGRLSRLLAADYPQFFEARGSTSPIGRRSRDWACPRLWRQQFFCGARGERNVDCRQRTPRTENVESGADRCLPSRQRRLLLHRIRHNFTRRYRPIRSCFNCKHQVTKT